MTLQILVVIGVLLLDAFVIGFAFWKLSQVNVSDFDTRATFVVLISALIILSALIIERMTR